MNNQSFLPAIVPLFQTVEEHLHNRKLELALSAINSILAYDKNNFYALAIKRRIKRVLDFQQDPSAISDSTEYYIARVIAALENVCQMAVRFLTNLSTQTSIHDMNSQLREQALENKHQALLHRARQRFQSQEYGRALQEAERARILRPHSVEADALILKIKAHMATPSVKGKQHVQSENVAMDGIVKPKQQRDLKSKTAIESSEAVTEKILASISFADYHRTNGDYAVCLRYIAQGLELDSSNGVLLQMKEEVEKIVMEKFSEKETSFQLT
ncbi:MAG: hypothetical protein ABR936_09025 [Bacteroidota bacterium]|jgi:tetratricopeptide (TPR) repeat protein